MEKALPAAMLHKKLQKAKAKVDAAEKVLDAALAEVQTTCTHQIVTEKPYERCLYFPSMSPRRICLHCRYEEEGTASSGKTYWYAKEGPTILGNTSTRIVTAIEKNEFYNLRLP